jgi:hypothetical protein
MSKLTTLLGLLLVIMVVFIVDILFGNPLKETFTNHYPATSEIKLGSQLDYNIVTNVDKKNGDLKYPGLKYLGIDTTAYNKEREDDQPLFFGFRI